LEEDEMEDGKGTAIGRRELLTRTAPACAMACLGLGTVPELATALAREPGQDQHRFDVRTERPLSTRDLVRMQNGGFIGFIRTLREELPEPDLIRLLKANSTKIGEQQGAAQRERLPDTTFETFVSQFRPPNYANSLTHEVVVDTEDTFELRVTECVWAAVFREAGLEGEIGHAAVCNMDYAWPPAFSPDIKMERTRTLMQGHDHCNHRYLKVADR
jgi:hypothetical protein